VRPNEALQQAKADHDYGDVNRLLVENTELTRAVHELTKEVHDHLFGTTTTND